MYKCLIFDLDDTLTDDFENCREAFKIMIASRNEEYSEEDYLRFKEIDNKVWADRAAGKLITPYEDNDEKKKEWIRASRILKYYGQDAITYEEAVKLNEIYIEGMKEKVVARPDAKEVMKYLYEKGYRIVIATNGPLVPLKEKLKKIEIIDFVWYIFSAEEAGQMKPHPKFYEKLFEKANINPSKEVLFIGDNLETDIKGGIEHGLDTCWCNYNNEINNKYSATHEIKKLKDLITIL
ncbi:MAG: HAD-IA family hydrolase [Clostridia bacterium]|nr:HAD-IA family hydrolase [Clostridia bacterium]